MQFLRSIWKILHLTEYFYTGTARGARNNYQVWVPLASFPTFGPFLDPTLKSGSVVQRVCRHTVSGLNKASDSKPAKLLRSSTYFHRTPAQPGPDPSRKMFKPPTKATVSELFRRAFAEALCRVDSVWRRWEAWLYRMCKLHPPSSKPAKTSRFTLSDFVHMSRWTHDTLHDPPNELLTFNPFGFGGWADFAPEVTQPLPCSVFKFTWDRSLSCACVTFRLLYMFLLNPEGWKAKWGAKPKQTE